MHIGKKILHPPSQRTASIPGDDHLVDNYKIITNHDP